ADARPNYAMLNAIPERLREHADRLDADVETLETQVAERELAALDAVGGKAARETLMTARTRLAAIDEDIIVAEDARETLTENQKQMADGGHPAYAKAVELLSEAISTTDVERLIADARATRTS